MAGITKESITNTPIEVLAHPGRIVEGMAINTGATSGYLVFFDKRAADVTLGTTRPDYYVSVSPGENDPIVNAGPLFFFTAITVAAVDTPLTALAANMNASFQII
jgi:hypothetical protein